MPHDVVKITAKTLRSSLGEFLCGVQQDEARFSVYRWGAEAAGLVPYYDLRMIQALMVLDPEQIACIPCENDKEELARQELVAWRKRVE